MEDWIAGGHDVDEFTDKKPLTTYRLFHQDRWWKDVGGVWHELASMDPRHRANLLLFLRRRAQAYQDAAHHDATRLFYDAPDHVFEEAMDEFEVPAEEWIEATPLVAALRYHEGEATAIDHLRTWSHNRTYKLRKRLGLARS